MFYQENYNTTRTPIVPPGQPSCVADSVFEQYFQLAAVACSVVIIVFFSILEKRNSEERCQCVGGRFGLIYPVNMLDNDNNRFGYAVAFGSTTSAIWNLFTNPQSYYTTAPAWSKTLVIMSSVLFVGMQYYPLFACLTTPWVFLGSAIGILYSGAWFIYSIREVIKCPDGLDGEGLAYQTVVQQFPVLVCLFLLIVVYVNKFVQHTVRTLRNDNTRLMAKGGRKPIATEYNQKYVRQLLTPADRSQISQYEEMVLTGNRTRRMKSFVSKWFYKNDPTFQYSTKVICVLTVSLICAYEFGIVLILIVNEVETLIPYLYPGADNSTTYNSTDTAGLYQVRVALNVFSISVMISFIVSSLLTLYSIFQILVNYRHNLKLMFKGAYSHFPFNRENRRPHFIMSDSLAYAGSQVGYIIWGYIIMFVVLLLFCFLIAYLIILPLAGTIPKNVLLVIVNAIPAVAVYQALIIIQQVSCGILLQSSQTRSDKGKEISKSVLAVDNRKIYHNASYFLFFFYIVLGLFGCLFTILKGMILGIFYLARLENCGLSRGFETWDRGYMYYLSFLYVEECHRHPVLLVFCDILYDYSHRHDIRLKRYGTVDQELAPDSENPGILATQISLSPERKLIRNRWLKAYTLIKNRSLVKQEEDGRTSCDSDDILLDLDREQADDEHTNSLLNC